MKRTTIWLTDLQVAALTILSKKVSAFRLNELTGQWESIG